MNYILFYSFGADGYHFLGFFETLELLKKAALENFKGMIPSTKVQGEKVYYIDVLEAPINECVDLNDLKIIEIDWDKEEWKK